MKLNPQSLFVPLTGILLACTSYSLAAAPIHDLRCGSRLVSVGANTTRLIQNCGQPASVEQATYQVPVKHYDEESGKTITTYEDRPYEIWVYNFGPSRFVTRIRVEGNQVRQMETDGYGW
jgi:hypothetical protein